MQDRVQEQTDAPANDTDTIDFNFDAAVVEGKQILKQIETAERGQLRLGELADGLERVYGDRTLAKYAAELGIAKCTLQRYQNVHRAWKGKVAPGPPLPSYAVLRELQTNPEREQIIRENPKITKREAAALERKRKNIERPDADTSLKKFRSGFNAMCTRTAEAARWAEGAANADLDQASQKIERLTFANFGRDARLLVKYFELMAPFVLDEEAGLEQEAPDMRDHAQPEATIQEGLSDGEAAW
jgi:hypothetical protein